MTIQRGIDMLRLVTNQSTIKFMLLKTQYKGSYSIWLNVTVFFDVRAASGESSARTVKMLA